MANNQALAAARDLVGPKVSSAFDSARLVGAALNAGEDIVRGLMRKHPYALLAGSLSLGAVIGLVALRTSRAAAIPVQRPIPVQRQRRWWW
jgi:hypothetical protein